MLIDREHTDVHRVPDQQERPEWHAQHHRLPRVVLAVPGLSLLLLSTFLRILINTTKNVETSAQIPLGIQKLKILIMGKAEVEIDGVQVVVNVLDNGKAWVPGERKSKKKYRNNVHRFRRIWGVAYDEIVAAAAKEPHLH